MKVKRYLYANVLALSVSVMTSAQIVQPTPAPELAHVSNTFQFVIAAPLSQVAPLFGPEAERSWAARHWNPEFLYPQSPKDIQGAVFRVRHGDHNSIWVNTLFDLAEGRMQYVAVIDNIVATTVDVKLTASNASHTRIKVTYVRTALQLKVNDDVRSLGDKDRASGPEWQSAIEKCLGLSQG